MNQKVPLGIEIAPDEHGVLIFGAWRSWIEREFAGVQILPQSGGGNTGTKSTDETDPKDALRNIRFAYGTFLEHCSIAVVNIVSNPKTDYCTIYVNFNVNPAQRGYNHWTGTPYMRLMRCMFENIYERVIVRKDGSKWTVRFKDPIMHTPWRIENGQRVKNEKKKPDDILVFAPRREQKAA